MSLDLNIRQKARENLDCSMDTNWKKKIASHVLEILQKKNNLLMLCNLSAVIQSSSSLVNMNFTGLPIFVIVIIVGSCCLKKGHCFGVTVTDKTKFYIFLSCSRSWLQTNRKVNDNKKAKNTPVPRISKI